MVKLQNAHQKICVFTCRIKANCSQIPRSTSWDTWNPNCHGNQRVPPPYHPSKEIRSYFSALWPPPSFRLQGWGSKGAMWPFAIISDFAKFLANVQITKPDSEKINYVVWLSPQTYICRAFKPIQKLIKSKNGNLPYTLDTNRANCWKFFSHTFLPTHLPISSWFRGWLRPRGLNLL